MGAKIHYGKDLAKAMSAANCLLGDLRLMAACSLMAALPQEEYDSLAFDSSLSFKGPSSGLIAFVTATGKSSRWTFEFSLDGKDNHVLGTSSILVGRYTGPGNPHWCERCMFSREFLEDLLVRMASTI